jgi:uncharacterized protein
LTPTYEELNLAPLERGQKVRFWIKLAENGLGQPLAVPILVARGSRPGPVVGVTAAVHGNELNGIPIIQRLFRALDPAELKGTVVGVPVVNVPGYLQNRREFNDNFDLNRLFPGHPTGSMAEVFAYRFIDRIVRHFEYLFDLHTASFGRVNALYIRADMTHPVSSKIARVFSPQVIVHNTGADGTLRSAAADLGIHALTVEVGDPHRFQRGLIRHSRLGIQAALDYLGMFDDDDTPLEETTVECFTSSWIYTDRGGVLQVHPGVTDRVKKGERIATVSNLFGEVIGEYFAPTDGVVIGKGTNPVAQTGSRILHLGLEGKIPTVA